MPSESSSTDMTPATRKLLARARHMIPPMLDKFHKGQLGRIAVIGGSEDYTGAPYFSAMASARLGCDMSHIICTPAAAAVIKTYSPNLMVHPLMRQSEAVSPTSSSSSAKDKSGTDAEAKEIADKIVTELLPRLHVLVVGPGLGRDSLMQATVARVVAAARERDVPVVMDADALQLVQKDPGLVRGWGSAVLTPNVVEFGRLCKALEVKEGGEQEGKSSPTEKVEALARALDGVTVIQKGGSDYISDGKQTLVSDGEGGRKRSGGQGDTLTGCIATFLGWRKAYQDGIWDVKGELTAEEMVGLAAFAGSAVTRECSRRAFEKKGRSLQASDLTDEVHPSFLGLFGNEDERDDSAKL